MSDISDAADLIATARDALLAELLPALPKERRYTGLMIANAMAIAVREERLGFDAARSEAARLRNLLDAVGASPMRAADPIDTELDVARVRSRRRQKWPVRRSRALEDAGRRAHAHGVRPRRHLESEGAARRSGRGAALREIHRGTVACGA